MKWIKVKDEFPPISKVILIGSLIYRGCENKFTWDRAMIFHPYPNNPRFNPNYYYYVKFNEENQNNEYELGPHDYWMEIEQPKDEDLK